MPIRPARASDLAALVAIENESFVDDRLSRRSLRYFLAAPNTVLLVFDARGSILGYSLVALRKGSRLARLYSIAVCRAARGRDLGNALLRAAEAAARRHGATDMRLEVRGRNRRAIALYQRRGYRCIGQIEDYYADGAPALRYEKSLIRIARQQ
ncbi:MAG TPA: GNAT family N-acetyltransferase [Methylovirgula sp.]|nr:GNAT family N-acetyltransferase [Methylovirgula sp.]